MKRHIKLRVLAILLTLAGAMLGAIWAVFSLAFAGQLLMNGPYLIALLCALFGVAFAWASVRAERLICEECGGAPIGHRSSWPCPTVAALDGAPEPEVKP